MHSPAEKDNESEAFFSHIIWQFWPAANVIYVSDLNCSAVKYQKVSAPS